jgi:predicted membrane channel-forming protein YqfA (hemolysin III family)
LADKAASPENRVDWIRTNQGVGVVITALIIVLLIYLSQQEWVFQRLRDGFQLGFFTVVSAFTMLLCSVAMIFDGFKNKTDKEMSAMNRLDFIMPVVVVAVCYIYFLLAWRYDFLLVTPIFLAAGIYSFGIRPLRTVIIGGIVITLTIFGLFRLIGIYLPSYIIPA